MQQVWCNRLSRWFIVAGSACESGHEFSVGGAGGGQVVVAFVELLLKVEVVLFELADALVEGVDVDGGAEPGLAPGMFAKRFGKPFLQLVDAGVEAGGSFVGGQQVRPQRRICDRVIAVHIGDWICLQRMDFLQQVAVTVEECAVDSGPARDGGRTDRVARGGGLVEHRQHPLAAAPRVVVPAVEHRQGLSVRGRGHALASGDGVVGGAGGVTVSTGMPSGTVWAAR